MSKVVRKTVSDVFGDWPASNAATDKADLSLLLDAVVISDFRCTSIAMPQGRAQLLLQQPSMNLDSVIKAHGDPTQDKTLSKYDLRFITYGRIRLLADAQGTVFAVLFHE